MILTIPKEYKSFLNALKRKCKYNGINLILSPSDSVIIDENDTCHSGGYFSSDTKSLVVAVSKPIERWFPLLVHESCHMDQWLSKDERLEEWDQACIDFFEWIEKTKLLNTVQLNNVVRKMIDLELDCEKRSVLKIKEWGLPISVSEYIRKANSYLFSYSLIREYKKWPAGIYLDDELVKTAPKTFQKDYMGAVPNPLAGQMKRFFENLK